MSDAVAATGSPSEPVDGGRSGPASAPTCWCSAAVRSSTCSTTTPSRSLDDVAGAVRPHGDSLGLGGVPSVAPQNLSLNVTVGLQPGLQLLLRGPGRVRAAPRPAPCRRPPPRRRSRPLLAGCDRAPVATIGFLGGEPFLHRGLVHHVVGFTARRAAELGQPVGFSVTTNATVLDAADLDLVLRPPVRGDGQPRRRTGRPTTAAASASPARAAGTTPWPTSGRCSPTRGWPG